MESRLPDGSARDGSEIVGAPPDGTRERPYPAVRVAEAGALYVNGEGEPFIAVINRFGSADASLDAAGLKRTFARDRNGQISRVTFPDNRTLVRERNARGDIVFQQDTVPSTREGQPDRVRIDRFEWSEFGGLKHWIDPSGTQWSVELDGKDNPMAFVSPNGYTTRLDLTDTGQVAGVSFEDPAFPGKVPAPISSVVDDFGNTVRSASGTGDNARVTEFTRGPFNLTETVTDPAGDVWRFDRDDLGFPTVITHPDGESVTAYTYDEGKRMTHIVSPEGRLHQFEYSLSTSTYTPPGFGGERKEQWSVNSTGPAGPRAPFFPTGHGSTSLGIRPGGSNVWIWSHRGWKPTRVKTRIVPW